jgi:alanine dehydrogenase
VSGANAAMVAAGMGADVTILELNPERLRALDNLFQFRVKTLMANHYNIMNAVKEADLLIGAVLLPGTKAPRIITEEMVKEMSQGSVIVDLAIDQGSCVETIDHATTFDDPVFIKHGVVHYCVANMPGAVARTSTLALTNATLPYALEIANMGCKNALLKDQALFKGTNVYQGKVTYQGVAESLGLEYTPLSGLLS